MQKQLEETPGQLTLSDYRDIPYHMETCSAYKAGVRRGSCLEQWGLLSQITVMGDGAQLFWEMAEHLPDDGNQ